MRMEMETEKDTQIHEKLMKNSSSQATYSSSKYKHAWF